MQGGIDKRALARGKEEIDREVLSKVPWLCLQGGFFPQVDHLVPPDVSFENYLHYATLLRAVVEDPARYLAERGNAGSGKTEPARGKGGGDHRDPAQHIQGGRHESLSVARLDDRRALFRCPRALAATAPARISTGLSASRRTSRPSAYQYRCDRPAADNPPESVFLFTALKHNKAAALCGLLWEEPRPVRRVVLAWPAAAKAVPKPEQVVLRWFPEGGSSSWWCRAGEGSKLHEADKPTVSADGRVLTYTLDALANDKALDNLIVAVKDGAGPAGSFDVPTIEVLAPQTWKPLDLVIEWGFREGTVKLPYDGSVEIYNGLLGTVAPLAGDQGAHEGGRRLGVAGGWNIAARADGPHPLRRLHGHARLARASENRGRQPHDRDGPDPLRQLLVPAGRP